MEANATFTDAERLTALQALSGAWAASTARAGVDATLNYASWAT